MTPQPLSLARQFFAALWPTTTPGDLCFAGEYSASGQPTRRHSEWRAVGDFTDVDRMVQDAHDGQVDLYFGVCAADKDRVRRAWEAEEQRTAASERRDVRPFPGSHIVRGREAAVTAVPAVWADLDICDGVAPKSEKYATRVELLKALEALPPSILVSTGGGYHAYWMLDDPWVIRTDADRADASKMTKAFQERLAGHVLRLTRKTIDRTGNLARVLRVPGSLNCKYGSTVEIVRLDMRRFSRTEIGTAFSDPAPLLACTPTPASASPTVPTYSALELSERHREILRRSSISDDVAAARGYRTVTDPAELERVGFTKPQRRVPALIHPVHDVHGEIAFSQIRPDEPRTLRDKPVKYETPKNARVVIDVPPGARAALGNPEVPLFVTEGVRKADAAVSQGLCCIALLGVWNWRGKNDLGGTTVLPDWESITLKGRDVVIAFDSDVMTKPSVQQALSRLESFLKGRGAITRRIHLDAGTDGSKVGLDDYFALGGTAEALLTPPAEGPPAGDDAPLPYDATARGLFHRRMTRDGEVRSRISNFTARITTEISEDDGVEIKRQYEIDVTVKGTVHTVRVPAASFATMDWVTERVGAGAVVWAGLGTKDHVRAAIQLLSTDIASRRVYSHLGWREVDGRMVYLHAGGGIGEGGARPEIEVHVEGALERFQLPDVTHQATLTEDIRACLRILDLGDLTITAPVFAAPWRAALGEADVTIHLVGPTGQFKTELAALAQRHFGASMDAEHLPGSWMSTANALEALAFLAKDSVFVIDEFVPTGSADGARMYRDAERVIRAKANSSGRARMKSDTSLRASRPPRALILSTGEDIPRGQSLRARMFVVEVPAGAISAAVLSQCQTAASEGAYARVMASFVRWLAPDYASIARGLPSATAAMREEIARKSQGHRRTPEAVAHLLLGVEAFGSFAAAVGAISDTESECLVDRCRTALTTLACSQSVHVTEYDTARRFIELLRSAISSGRAYLVWASGVSQRYTALSGASGPGATAIGWSTEERVYLDFTSAMSVVQRLAKDTGDELTLTALAIKQRLDDAGFLADKDPRGGITRREVRRTLGGAKRNVVSILPSTLWPTDEQGSAE